MSGLKRRIEWLEGCGGIVAWRRPEIIVAPRSDMTTEDEEDFIAAELGACGRPEDTPVIFVHLASMHASRDEPGGVR